jgi:hypothetical protein
MISLLPPLTPPTTSSLPLLLLLLLLLATFLLLPRLEEGGDGTLLHTCKRGNEEQLTLQANML